jgi:hypothetical protein
MDTVMRLTPAASAMVLQEGLILFMMGIGLLVFSGVVRLKKRPSIPAVFTESFEDEFVSIFTRKSRIRRVCSAQI